MRLFFYYALHSFKNQIRKLLKTWVLIFLVVCMLFGGVIGIIAGTVSNSLENEAPEDISQTEMLEDPDTNMQADETEYPKEDFLHSFPDVSQNDVLELFIGGLSFCIFLVMAFNADKNGSKIFLPADVNLLFASPMKPQSVLMFRLTTQLSMIILCSIYMLFQLPNLTSNFGLSIWTSIAIIAVWCFTIILSTLMQVLLYALASTYPKIKRFLRAGLYALLAVIAASYYFVFRLSGAGWLKAAIKFFNAELSRFIPFWGWLKGICMFTAEGNTAAALLCLAATVLGGAALVYFIWHIKVDFYEDAMAKSEETAALLEKAQSDKSSGILITRKKDRSEKLRRDRLSHGFGASIFFFKTLYNRFRFAHLKIFTKTEEFYLAAACGVGLICRFFVHTTSVVPLALTLTALSFFRSLGNPLEQDTSMDYFVLIPESTWAKLFWSLMGGTANCLLDVSLPMLAGAFLAGVNPIAAIFWIPFIVSMDFYATTVGTFIGLSVPVNAGKIIKQVVQILFIYFGLLPDILILAAGILFHKSAVSIILAAVCNIGLGLLFFSLSPLFLGPHGGKTRRQTSFSCVNLPLAKKHFSIIGTGIFGILTITSVLQLAAAGILNYMYPYGDYPTWLMWLCTFAPMYAAAVPAGLLILRRVPASSLPKRGLKPGRLAAAAIICIFMMYAGNILGLFVTSLLQSLFGLSAVNPVLTYAAEESVWLKILVMVILAPLIEEYIFRRQIIDRINIYGEKLAVVTSALMFGLFHGNLSQFFYAFALGLVFAYIYLKTGRLRYCAALHMFINFIGSVVGPGLMNNINLEALEGTKTTSAGLETLLSPQLIVFVLYALFILVLAIAGLILLCINSRNIHFDTANAQLPKGTVFKTVYLNTGMLLFVVTCLASVILTCTL